MIANCKGVNNQTCRTLQNLRVITFFKEVFDTFGEQSLKMVMSDDFPKFVYHITIKIWVRYTLHQERLQITLILVDEIEISEVKFSESFSKFMVSITLF